MIEGTQSFNFHYRIRLPLYQFLILKLIHFLQALESSPQIQPHIDSDHCSLDCEGTFLDDFSDFDGFSDTEVGGIYVG